jgi:hypothetical protein
VCRGAHQQRLITSGQLVGIEEARGPEETLLGEQRACHLVVPRHSGDDLRRVGRGSTPSNSLGRGVTLRCSAAADVDQVPPPMSAVSGVETIHDPHLEPA